MNPQLEYAINNQTEVLNFLKSRYPLYNASNLFLRDVQFGLIEYFREKGMRLTNRDAEKVARGYLDHLKKNRIVSQIDQQTWALHYPDFALRSASLSAAAEKPQAPVQKL